MMSPSYLPTCTGRVYDLSGRLSRSVLPTTFVFVMDSWSGTALKLSMKPSSIEFGFRAIRGDESDEGFRPRTSQIIHGDILARVALKRTRPA
jgi:hypothetical protein